MLKTYRVSWVVSILFILSACARGFQADPTQSATQIESAICSKSAKTTVFDELNRLADAETGYPDQEALRRSLSARLLQHWDHRLSRTQEEGLDAASNDLSSVYLDLLNEAQAAPPKEGQDAHQAMLSNLAELELGDDSTPSRARLQADMVAKLDHVRDMLMQTDASCDATSRKPVPATPTPETQTLLGQWSQTEVKPVYGAWKTMATAYQSCDVVGMDPMTSETPSTQGVTQYLHKKGVYYRKISNLNEFLRTNPYYKGYRAPAATCVPVEKNPLVYDFGGKPSYASSTSPLNLFKEAGNGTPDVLGVDCSGFITTAMLTAGLRLQSGTALRSSFVESFAARSYQNPVKSKMTCLAPISVSKTKTIMPGDILASATHVLMIDSVGADPFGVNQIASASQCTSANVDYAKFNFTVIQSSSVKNSIGINRIQASSYFGGSETAMRIALEEYAIGACRARFGSATTPVVSEATIVRHSGTAACLESSPVALTSQECLDTCAAR